MIHRAPDAVIRVVAWRPAAIAVRLISVVVLSRLLEPEAFGAFAVISSVYLLLASFAAFGLDSWLTRAAGDVLSDRELGLSYGIWIVTTAFGVSAMLLAAILAGHLDAPPGTGATIAILALALIPLPSILVGETTLRRSLELRRLSWFPVVCAALGVAVSTFGAVRGLGIVALALGILAERALLLWLLVHAAPVVSKARPTLRGWSDAMRFGATVTTTELLPKAVHAARLAVASWSLGAPSIGLYERASVVARINDDAVFRSLQPLGMPIMADAMRSGVPRGAVYTAKVDYVAALCWPGATVTFVLADPLVDVLLGSNWSGTVPLVRLLCISALSYPFTRLATPVFALLGAEDRALRIQLTQQAIGFLLAAVGAMFSLTAFVVAIVIGHLIKGLRIAHAIETLIGDGRGGLGAALLRATLISISTGLGAWMALAATSHSSVASLLLAAPVVAAGWAIALAATGHPMHVHVRRALKALLARRRPSA